MKRAPRTHITTLAQIYVIFNLTCLSVAQVFHRGEHVSGIIALMYFHIFVIYNIGAAAISTVENLQNKYFVSYKKRVFV